MARDEYVDAMMNGEDNEEQLAEHWSFPISATHLARRTVSLLQS